MALPSPADLDRIVKNIELENQQLVKLIDQEKQQIEAIEKETEFEKERTVKLQESNSQLDEEIKRHHNEFIRLRDNCDSLKKTATILGEHEDVLIKKLDQVVIESERERIERDSILGQYRAMWNDYRDTYESFPNVQELRNKQREFEEMELVRLSTVEHVNQLREKIRAQQRQKESTSPPFPTMEQFIVKLAEIKIDTMRTEKEIEKFHEENKELEKRIPEVREQLRMFEEDRLMRMAIMEQEMTTPAQTEMEEQVPDDSCNQMNHDGITALVQPAVLQVDQMIQHEVPKLINQSQVSQTRLSTLKTSHREDENILTAQVSKSQMEVPLLRQLQQASLQQKFMIPEEKDTAVVSQSQENIPSTSASLPRPFLQTTQISIPQLTTPRTPLLMSRPLQPVTPRMPQSPMLTMPRLPVMMTPRPPEPQKFVMPAPQTPKLMMSRPKPPKVITAPKIQVPERPRLTLPLEMIGTPSKTTELPPNVDTPQPAPPRPAEFPRVSLPMEMIGRETNVPRIPVTASPASIHLPETPARVPTSSPAGFDSFSGYSPQAESDALQTPDRPGKSCSTPKTPRTPGEQSIPQAAENSPFDIEKHFKLLSELKNKSPGFSFHVRDMIQQESDTPMVQSSSGEVGFSTPRTSNSYVPSPSSNPPTPSDTFNFGFGSKTDTGQPFQFGGQDSPTTNGFNFGGGDSHDQQNNFSFGGFSGGGDNASRSLFSMFGDGGKETPSSPQAGFTFAGFGGGAESPSFGGAGGGLSLF